MKKIILLVILFISIQSFGQFKLYAIRGNTDGTTTNYYLKQGTDSLFDVDTVFVSFSVEHFEGQFEPTYPNSFGKYLKCADNIYRDPLAIFGVKVVEVPLHADAAANLALTNHPNSEQPLANSQRSAVKVQTGGYSEVRLTAIVLVGSSSANSPRIYLQYSTNGTNWTGDGSGGNISLTTTGAKETAWVTLPVGAVGDVYVRAAMNGGNNTEDPALGNVTIQLR